MALRLSIRPSDSECERELAGWYVTAEPASEEVGAFEFFIDDSGIVRYATSTSSSKPADYSEVCSTFGDRASGPPL